MNEIAELGGASYEYLHQLPTRRLSRRSGLLGLEIGIGGMQKGGSVAVYAVPQRMQQWAFSGCLR